MVDFQAPITLTGRGIRLVPLSLEHAPALRAGAVDPEIGRFLLPGPGTTLADMEAFITFLLERQKTGTELPFAIVHQADDRPVGMTRYLRIDRTNHSVEVGGTWLDAALGKTPLNTESKYLLFRHAFDTEKAHRVGLRVDLRDVRGQRSITRLGAIREAIFRDDTLLPDGSFRTSVVYGILTSEWPRVRAGLEAVLGHEWNLLEPRGLASRSTDAAEEARR
jgi:RimJ/RimL family protein N-acetyltransferase